MPLVPPDVQSGDPIRASNFNQLLAAARMIATSTGQDAIIDPATGIHIRRKAAGRQADLSLPQYQFQCYVGVAANQAGWDYVRSYPTV